MEADLDIKDVAGDVPGSAAGEVDLVGWFGSLELCLQEKVGLSAVDSLKVCFD